MELEKALEGLKENRYLGFEIEFEIYGEGQWLGVYFSDGVEAKETDIKILNKSTEAIIKKVTTILDKWKGVLCYDL